MKRLMAWILIFIGLSLTSNTLAQQVEPLPVDQAFQFSATARDYQTVLAMWTIAPGYHLYKDRFHFRVLKPKSMRIGQPLMPAGITKSSPEIGQYQAFTGQLSIPIPIINSDSKTIELQVSYQGCADKGYCYPPTTKVVPINLAGNYGTPVQGIEVDVPTSSNPFSASDGQNQKIHDLLAGKSLWALILGFLGFGILISFTPCVLPMIPILSGIIVGQKHLTTARSFALSFCYVLGMALTYAVAGVIFGMIGGSLQAMLQQPWIIGAFSLIFVLLALSLFGFYDIQLPEKWRSKLAHASDKQKRGTYIGAAVMGIFSTLILSPCVTPPLVGVLGYIGQTGNASLGGIALFTMGLGMGLPLLIIGASGGKLLPKAGHWMNAIKNLMGIMLLGVAIYMVERVIPGWISMLAWAVLCIGTAIYCGAFRSTKSAWELVGKLFGIIIFIYGILLAAGAIMGNTNPLRPINFNGATAAQGPKFINIKTVSNVNEELGKSVKLGKPIMLDFYADWCISCKEMDHFTFANPQVMQELKRFTLLRADVTKNDMEDKMLERHFRVVAPPTILFFNKNGKEIKKARIIGEMSATKFLAHLKQIKE